MPVDLILNLITSGVQLTSAVTKAATPNKKANGATTIVNRYNTYHIDTNDKRLQNEKDLRSCITLFNEGMEVLFASLNRIECGERPDSCDRMTNRANILGDRIRGVFGSADVDKLKTVSKESFEWAKSSFKSARVDATRAFVNEALDRDYRLLAARVIN